MCQITWSLTTESPECMANERRKYTKILYNNIITIRLQMFARFTNTSTISDGRADLFYTGNYVKGTVA